MNNQAGAMQGQLNEMRATGLRADKLIATNEKLADAANVGNRAWIAASPRITLRVKEERCCSRGAQTLPLREYLS
jgi:hypothetical protein